MSESLFCCPIAAVLLNAANNTASVRVLKTIFFMFDYSLVKSFRFKKVGGDTCLSRQALVFVLFYKCLYNALSHHSLGNLHEAGHVGTLHVVDVAVLLSTVLHAVLVNVVHDALQVVVDLFSRP